MLHAAGRKGVVSEIIINRAVLQFKIASETFGGLDLQVEAAEKTF